MRYNLAPHHVITRFLLPLGSAAMGASVAMTGAFRVAVERGNPITDELIINACTKGLWVWPELLQNPNDNTIQYMVMDTEGLGSLEEG
jgi:hypothetical protein